MTSSVENKWQGIVQITRADKPMMVTYLLPNTFAYQSFRLQNTKEKS